MSRTKCEPEPNGGKVFHLQVSLCATFPYFTIFWLGPNKWEFDQQTFICRVSKFTFGDRVSIQRGPGVSKMYFASVFLLNIRFYITGIAWIGRETPAVPRVRVIDILMALLLPTSLTSHISRN